MIYNLLKDMQNKFPAEKTYANVYDEITIDRCISIRETSGMPEPRTLKNQALIQIKTRDIDAPKARALAYSIFDEYNDRYGITLPQNTVGGTVYPAIQIHQISANTTPQSLGSDDQNRVTFVTNYRFLFRL